MSSPYSNSSTHQQHNQQPQHQQHNPQPQHQQQMYAPMPGAATFIYPYPFIQQIYLNPSTGQYYGAPMPGGYMTAGVPMPSVTSVAQIPPVSVMSSAVSTAAQQSAVISAAHGIMPPGTTHLQTANVVVTSTGAGQQIPAPQQLQREKLKFMHPETKEELDFSGAVANETKKKAKPTTDGKEKEADKTDKSNHAKEFHKRIAELVKSGTAEKGNQNELNGDDDPCGVDRLTPSQDESGEVLTEERIREMEEKLQQMERSDENNSEQHIYSWELLYFIRKLTKTFKTVVCPKSEEELEELGLSLRGVSIVQTFSAGGKAKRFDSTSSDQFKTPWQQAGGGGMNQFGAGGGGRFTTTRPPYVGRHSDSKLKPKKQVVEALPRRSANAWKPKRGDRFDMSAPTRDEEEVKYEKLRKEVRGLLNKVTPSTYKDLSEDFIQYKIHEDPKLLEMIIDLIFDKAVEEPHFCALYSDLCKKQVEEEQRTMADKQPTEKSFRTEIIQKCQKTFAISNQFDEKIAELKKKIDELDEADEKGRAQLEEEIEQRRSKEKRRLLGIIRFISQLYRHQLLVDKVIIWCAVELIKRYEVTKDEVYIEYTVELLETVGKVYEERQQQNLQQSRKSFSQASEKDSFDKIFSHLTSLKNQMSNRIRFAILEVEDLRKSNWMPRGGEKGPKTIEEVREEVEKEQQENEMERIEHEKQKEKEKMQQTTRKGSRPSYGGRSSADYRSAAANVALPTNRTESRISGLSKLREVDSYVGLGGARKKWDQPTARDRTPQKEDGAGPTTGDGADGGFGIAAPETAWRLMSRGGTDSPKDTSGGQTGGD